MVGQALEGPAKMQVGRTLAEIRDQLGTGMKPRGWQDVLRVFTARRRAVRLAAGMPGFQRW
jgi:hypothetical protein